MFDSICILIRIKQKMTEKKTKQKNKIGLYEELALPDEISVEIKNDFLVMKRDGNELSRKLNNLISFRLEENKLIVSSQRDRRIEKRLFGTFLAHVKNMIEGLINGFKYKLQIANVHFQMNVSYSRENNELVVKNFLGEKKDRRIKLLPNVEVKVDKEIIELKSFDIEKAGQSATNIEKGTKVRNKDRRVYQDGIFIIEKPGRTYL